MPMNIQSVSQKLLGGERLIFSCLAESFEAFLVAEVIRSLRKSREGEPVVLVHVARDGKRARAFLETLAFIDPEIESLHFPGWDCQPYDRISPHGDILAQRMLALSRLERSRSSAEKPRILSTTANALLQRVPPRQWVRQTSFSAARGNHVNREELLKWLDGNGFNRVSTVRDIGEYAVRGGIVDVSPPGQPFPARLDFLGDMLETIRHFNPETQRTERHIGSLDLVPTNEAYLTHESIRAFRQNYIGAFGLPSPGSDPLYESVSEGRAFPGMEHWVPLFHPKMDSLFDYFGAAPILLDYDIEGAVGSHLSHIQDYYEARQQAYEVNPRKANYKPLPPLALYLSQEEWETYVSCSGHAYFSSASDESLTKKEQYIFSCGVQLGRSFEQERAQSSLPGEATEEGESPRPNVFSALVAYIKQLQAKRKQVILASGSDGARERLASILAEQKVKPVEFISSFSQMSKEGKQPVSLVVLPLERGFETEDFALISEQDVLGERFLRNAPRRARPKNFLQAISSLEPMDLVVHVSHGIGRFIGLQRIEAMRVPHDCLEIHYAGGDKLFLPVENLDLLARYGSAETEVTLDRLGGTGWQNRKVRMQTRIREMAHDLIHLAAQRQTRQAPVLAPPAGLYEEFCSRFPYDETEDQISAIDSVMQDLMSGRPMDRLICGDVGFGKTEVALRAAFIVAAQGKQVALVVPTTLLARQHYNTFVSRFADFPLTIGQVSRIVPSAELKQVKQGLTAGSIDIVVGTHALLSKTIAFKNLSLVIIDEEQHFGVHHKERLKELCHEVHVLTLSATPIPRTLQLAMLGVRELSIIASPPVDRLAVRTFVTPFDEMILREALLRERYRGGQSFYVCPHIEDLTEVAAFLRNHAPEASFVMAHGQMAARELEDKISAFYDGKYDILLSTSIVESGLDIPRANTLIVHRADRFGLSQLYQLRGRVGRSKLRAFALFTVPPRRILSRNADKRLQILQSLDTLGAGFELASHDLDIRGAGNLLGSEQSGHIKEVGYELYQQMLQEAIEQLKKGQEAPEELWAPTISMGTPVTIPEHYIEDLQVRLDLYRRLSFLEKEENILEFGGELTDRFGAPPPEVNHLLKLVTIKHLCRRAHIDKLEAGPRGAILSFRNNLFPNSTGLLRFIQEKGIKVRPDSSLVVSGNFESIESRLEGTQKILRALGGLAEKKGI